MSADIDVSDLSRDELEERVRELEALIEIKGADSAADADVSDIWIAGFPVGQILDNVESIAKSNRAKLDEMETADTDVSGASDAGVRDELVPLHLMYIDVRDGRGDALNANQRRAAKLFRRFIRKACGERDTRVSTGYGSYTLSSDVAIEILEHEDTLPTSGQSKTVKRVFDWAQRHTTAEDCGCDSLRTCGHGLLKSDKRNGKRRLIADQGAFDDYLRSVQAAIDGMDAPAADDAVSPENGQVEAGSVQSDEIMDELDRLDSSTQANGEVADTVVSNHDETMSAPDDPPSEDT